MNPNTFLISVAAALATVAVSITGAADVSKADRAEPTNKVHMQLKIGGKTFRATLEDNATARAFLGQLPLSARMTELNGNEKYFRLPVNLPTAESNPGKIEAGDVMLYGRNTLVLFYEAFPTSYSYTRIGRIEDVAGLAAAAGSADVTVTWELE